MTDPTTFLANGSGPRSPRPNPKLPQTHVDRDPIAIVGIGCHLPGGADSPAALWELLAGGTDATRDIPPDRWDVQKFYDADRTKLGKTNVMRGGFLDRVDQFDAQFFGISPREAIWLDPQQRLLLRVAYESIEDAGLDLNKLSGQDIGVFMGGFTLDYQLLQNYGVQSRYELQAHSATGMMMTMLANRLSHAFNFTGPSMAVDTACSGSLVAVHLASQSIWRGECSAALAGGVNIMLAPNMTIAESKGGFLSPDGRCKTFDSSADGYGRGEGAGIVVLKPLSAALAAGDPVYAVIRGTAVTQDGRTDGITVPNGKAQQAAMRAAYAAAGIAPHQVQYVEAHGTGTPVGDPIEAAAIGAVLSEDRPATSAITIGSVKTNIGHLEAAAGIAGLIKTALCLHHQQIPPHLNLTTPNPDVPFDQFNLRVPGALEDWAKPAHGPRVGGVNSFGFGGTNAHVVLTDCPPAATSGGGRTRGEDPGDRPDLDPIGTDQPLLLPVSARSPEALAELAAATADRLRGRDVVALRDHAASAARRRTHHDLRAVIVARTTDEAVDRLAALAAGRPADGVVTGRVRDPAPKVAFVCTGMGPQWWAMGRQLFASEPVFRTAIERCSAEFARHSGWSLVDTLLADEETSRMAETEVAQPANFAVQVGLAELWRSRGIVPDAIIGHSTGELAAQYLSGVLTFEDAVRVAYYRSSLQQLATGTGRMLAVGLSAETLEKAVDETGPTVSVAAINSSDSVTMSGDPEVLANMAAQLETFGVFHRFLNVKVPYHSHLMDPLRDDLLRALADLKGSSARIPLYSTVTGTRIDGSAVDGNYWWQNVRSTVLFAAAFNELVADGYLHFVELGPHPVLASSMRELLEEQEQQGLIIASMRRGADDQDTFAAASASLHCHGHSLPWQDYYGTPAKSVDLPRYPWQLKRYWNESKEAAEDRHFTPIHPLLGQRLNAPHPTWEVELSPTWLPYLADHRIQDNVVVPAAALIEMILAAAEHTYTAGHYRVEDLDLQRAIILDQLSDPRLRTTLRPDTGTVEIASFRALPNGDRFWTVHATARLGRAPRTTLVPVDPETAPADDSVTGDQFYEHIGGMGFQYGPAFQTITKLETTPATTRAWIAIPEAIAHDLDNYAFHPSLIDAAFQSLLPRGLDEGPDSGGSGTAYLPVGLERLSILGRPQPRMQAMARIRRADRVQIIADLDILDPEGQPLVRIEGFTAQSLEAVAATSPEWVDQALYNLQWEELPESSTPDATADDHPGVPETDQDLAGPAKPDSVPAPICRWALLVDETGVGEQLAEQLRRGGDDVLTIAHGDTERLTGTGPAGYRLDPTVPEQYHEMVRVLTGHGVEKIVHLWSLDVAEVSPTTTCADLLADQELVVESAFNLVRALATDNTTPPSGSAPRLWLVTRRAQAVTAGETPQPAQAPLWGFGRVIGHQELPGLWGGLIDVDGHDPAEDAVAIVTASSARGPEDQIAVRGRVRYAPRLDRLTKQGVSFPVRLDPDGSYLITGGFGALGLVAARYLADHGAVRIVLMGRTGLPDRQLWPALSPADPQAAAVAAVQQIEQRGCRVDIAAVDVSDETRLRSWFAGYRGAEDEDHPRPIRGVIHAAGTVEDELIQRMTPEQFRRVLRPKIVGAWNLHRLFEHQDLDFFTLFSSTASVIASPGQGNYASANAFLDALATHRASNGLPATSIGWGPWSIGMVEDLHLEATYRRLGIDLISPDAGASIMSRLIMEPPRPHVVAISVDWQAVRSVAPTGQLPGMFDRLADAIAAIDPTKSVLDEIRQAPVDQQPVIIADTLRMIIATVLGLDPEGLTASDSLTALGLDSMLAIEVRHRVQAALGFELSVLDLLNGATVEAMSARILAQLAPSPGADATGDGPDSVEPEPSPIEVDQELERLLADISDADLDLLIAELDREPTTQSAQPQTGESA